MQVEEGLRRAIDMDPTDGRAYVSLGKHYLQQRRYKDAAKVYEDGCAATQGQNPFIWQAWATLEVHWTAHTHTHTHIHTIACC